MTYKTMVMEDALEYIIDYRGKTPKKSDKGILTLSAKSVRDGYIDYSQAYFISEEEYKRFMVRGFPQVGDVLLTTEAPLGVTARLDRPGIALAQRLLALRGKKEILDTGFLYYYLKSPIGQSKLLARQTGTTVTGIKQAEFRKIEIELPPIGMQKSISAILMSIDEKIAINKKINDNLLQQLQVFYQLMFGKASQGSEPEWHLSDICAYSQRRVAVSSLSLESYYSTENMLPGKAGAVAASSLPTIAQTTGCKPGDILISNIRPYFKKIVYVQSECGCSTDVLCFVPMTSDLSPYLYSTLYNDHFFDYMVAGSKGTKMPRGDKQQIMAYPIVLPSQTQLAEFNAIAQPILARIEAGKQENKHLASMRDTLLPKLMSGEIDVSGIGI